MKAQNIDRLLEVPGGSFFLFGARGTGKSTWLRGKFSGVPYIDLLDSRSFLELSRHPENLAAMFGELPEGSFVVIDEIQRVPELLNEVHRLMEIKRWCFALCGSSARKLKRGGANLLAGRAVPVHMEGFSHAELPGIYETGHALEWGTLPLVCSDLERAADVLGAYVDMYIKEEITQEGLVRRLPPFLRFLEIAGIMNGQVMNAANIAREAEVPRSSVDHYFSILEDTMMGHFLPAYTPNVKVRERKASKFFWFDPGVARGAAGLLYEASDPLWRGTALETLIFQNLRIYNSARGLNRGLFHHRTAGGAEVDFVVETRKRRLNSPARIVCMEIKLADKWQRKWERPMREMKASMKVEVERMIGVYMGSQRYRFDGLDVLPVNEFFKELYDGKIF